MLVAAEPDLLGRYVQRPQIVHANQLDRAFQPLRRRVHDTREPFTQRCWGRLYAYRSRPRRQVWLLQVCQMLTQQLGRTPGDRELARHLSVTVDDLRQARQAHQAFAASSLDAPLSDREDPAQLADVLGEDDHLVEHAIDMEAVNAHWDELPEREQRILVMRLGVI